MDGLWLNILFMLTIKCSCRVLVEDTNLHDYGSYVQYNGIKFSINGKTNDNSSCTTVDCSVDKPLPREIENTIHMLVHNDSFFNENNNVAKLFLSPTANNFTGLNVHHRQKRIAPAVGAALIIGGATLISALIGSKQPKTQPDPYAEKRYLLEKDRSKMESIRFCTSMCAGEWGQWGPCSKQCGGGMQNRSRHVDHEDEMCVSKWQEYFNATFQCPHRNEDVRPCNEGCPNGGEPSPSGCSCPDGWGGNCCNRKLYCPFPGQPADGETIVGVTPSPVGSVAMFKCNEGFILKGKRHAMCRNNQSWSEPLPQCIRIECKLPLLRQHLLVMNDDDAFDFGHSVHYRCDQGYVLEGPEYQTCRRGRNSTGRWSMYTPQCTARECPVPTQADVPHGMVQGADFTYNSSITFDCWPGYDLIGLDKLICTKRGRWNGFYPVCQEISCIPPYPPVDGDMQLFGTDTVVFSCQEGYKLTDETKRVAVCQDDGQWSIPTPTCQAIECDSDKIDQVANGFVNGGVYRFPFSVKFGCYPGYVLQGLDEISCQENGEWSGDAPTCQACPADTYMEEWSTGGVCVDCPENTHTSTVGSTSRQQCLCNNGYDGPNGGPCQEVKCTLPNVPINGARGTCELNVGQECFFTCDPGYIPSKGSSQIECLANGKWSNQGLSCSACAADTYNPMDEPNVCLPCPIHMSTDGLTGQVLEGCACQLGWEGPPGGPCTDVDECDILSGEFSCEDQCVNTNGSFHCLCTIPGTVLNTDGLTCDLEQSCPALTSDDAPSNGALLCSHYEQYNTRYCSGRCNEGYEVTGDRPNNYETCGPHSGFQWSFQTDDIAQGLDPANSRLFDCIPSFFPGIKLWADIFYLSAACDELTDEQRNEVKEEFVKVLIDDEVCRPSEMSCSIDNVQLICGRREKRDANGNVWKSVDFNFEVNFLNVTHMQSTADCHSFVCPYFKIPERFCEKYCKSTIRNYAKALILHAEKKLGELTEEKLSRVRFRKVNQIFEPEDVAIKGKEMVCPRPGQSYTEAADDGDSYCRSCKEGEYLSESGLCEQCPAGTYQLLMEQSSCRPCPLGSYSQPGWAYCITCDDGFYGENCSHQCSCVHGKCNSENGECDCEPGWEGPNCSVDIDRCQSVACPVGTICLDKLPPEDGFVCI